jgi:hypothetical protein
LYLTSFHATGCADHDEYAGPCGGSLLQIQIWLYNSFLNAQNFPLECDRGIVVFDSTGTDGGVDVFMAKYGTINTPEGSVIATVTP